MAEMISFQADKAIRDNLTAKAARLGISRSELIRRQLTDAGPMSDHAKVILDFAQTIMTLASARGT